MTLIIISVMQYESQYLFESRHYLLLSEIEKAVM